eukprot:5736341-Pleurochrysis_carterae.AAC.2
MALCFRCVCPCGVRLASSCPHSDSPAISAARSAMRLPRTPSVRPSCTPSLNPSSLRPYQPKSLAHSHPLPLPRTFPFTPTRQILRSSLLSSLL